MDDSLDIFHAKERNILDAYLRWWMFNVSVRPIVKYFHNDCGGLFLSYLESPNLWSLSSVARMLCKEGNTQPLLLLLLSPVPVCRLFWPSVTWGANRPDSDWHHHHHHHGSLGTVSKRGVSWGPTEIWDFFSFIPSILSSIEKYEKHYSWAFIIPRKENPFSDWINDLKWDDTGSLSGLFYF